MTYKANKNNTTVHISTCLDLGKMVQKKKLNEPPWRKKWKIKLWFFNFKRNSIIAEKNQPTLTESPKRQPGTTNCTIIIDSWRVSGSEPPPPPALSTSRPRIIDSTYTWNSDTIKGISKQLFVTPAAGIYESGCAALTCQSFNCAAGITWCCELCCTVPTPDSRV